MLLGPVFNAELLMTARRTRYYVIRFLYAAIILIQIALTYDSLRRPFGYGYRPMSTRELAAFGLSMFTGFAVLQAVVVVLLTPALVAGTIADERQRKTLHYLLTSRLSGVEIVLSKLAARLLQVFVLVALGLPVVSLLGLFGGIDYSILLMSYGATFTTIYFLAALSIAISVVSRRPREAISLVYIVELCWLFAPTILLEAMPHWPDPWPAIAEWVDGPLRCVAVTSPIYVVTPRVWGSLYQTLAWGMGLQVLYGTILVAIASIQLRRSFRNEGSGRFARLSARIKTLGRNRRRWLRRPECSDDAMFWKEKYVSRASGLSRGAMALLGLALAGVIGYACYSYGIPAAAEMWDRGYFGGGILRMQFNNFLRLSSTALYLIWMLAVAAASASGLTSEREEDTWSSLTASSLTGEEIVRAKMFGPVWALRPIAFLMFAVWIVGLMLGALTPWGVAAGLVEFAIFTWFLTALGTFFSLRSKNSARSLAATVGLLIFLNGGYAFCCIPLRLDTPAIMFGCTPAVFAVSLMSYDDFSGPGGPRRYITDWVAASLLAVGSYGVAAAALMASAIQGFDAIIDRPSRDRQRLSPGQAHALVAGLKPPVTADDAI